MKNDRTIKREVCKNCEHLVSEHKELGCNAFTGNSDYLLLSLPIMFILGVGNTSGNSLALWVSFVLTLILCLSLSWCKCRETFVSKHIHKFKKCLECGGIE